MAQVEIIAASLKETLNKVKKVLKRVCAYARVSTDSEEQLSSYSSQIKYYTEKIKSNSDWEFVGIYADEGISGTQVKNRTEFQRMIEDALNDKIDMIIAKSISRFARNTLDTLKYVRLLREHNVDVYFEKENIHTLELDSEIFLTLYSAFAQAESESISQNVKMGFRAKMKRGEPCGRANPYGYDWDKEKQELIINEKQAEVVRQVFDLYITGYGGRTISKMLNDKKIPTYTGKKWEQSTIRNIITNEKYVGDLMGQKYYTENPMTHRDVRNFGKREKYYVKDHHIPIVTRKVWNKAQEILKKRNSKIIPSGSKHHSNYSMKYAFSSKIVCGFCGTNYVRRVGSLKKDGTRNVYWQCYQKIYDSKTCKDSMLIREDILEQSFIKIYNSIVKNKNYTKNKLLKAIKDTIIENNYQNDIEKLNLEEEKLNIRLSNLIDLRLDDLVNKDLFDLKEKEIKDRLNIIAKEKFEYQILINENKNISTRIKQIEKILDTPVSINKFDRDKFDRDKFDRDIFDSIVEKIIVGDIAERQNKKPNVIRFILKTGVYFDDIIKTNKRKRNNINEDVSFEERNKKIFLTHIHHLQTIHNK